MNTLTTAEKIRIGSVNILNDLASTEARAAKLAGEVAALDLDVLCLQEVIQDSFPVFEKHLLDSGLFTSGFLAPGIPNPHSGLVDGTAIFTRRVPSMFEVISFDEEYFAAPQWEGSKLPIPASVVRFTSDSGKPVHVISTHLAWGSKFEGVRLRQATAISAYAEKVRKDNPKAIVILAGDFNANEDSSTVRFLTGKQENWRGESTLWVDAWTMHGTQENWVTSDPSGFWGASTATKVGIPMPQFIPKRRIDYLMSYDWCYGNTGMPLGFSLFGHTEHGTPEELSDHFGVYADFLA